MIWTFVLIAIVLASFYAYQEYTRTNKDLSKLEAEIKISALDLIRAFEVSDSLANKNFIDKIIDVTGNVKVLEKDENGGYTIVLGDIASLSSVRCLADSNHRSDASLLQQNSTITIRGMCTGFKKNELLGENLGSDVELTRCVVIKK